MKLFPEQNGNLLNSLHNPSSLQPTLQQAAAIIPTLTNANSLEPVSNVIPLTSTTLNSLTVNNPTNYPLDMECDPVSTASLPSSSSLNTTNPSLLNSRYNFLLSGLSTSASSGAMLNGANTTNPIGGGSVGPMSAGNHAHLHRNSKSASNVMVQNFAPTSLPIGLYSGISNNGATAAVVNNDTHSLAAYQHHLLASGGVGPNGNITYIPYSMSSETVPKTNSTMTSSSSLSSS